MADDAIKAFWRDDAKLWWLQPEERARVVVAFLGTVFACAVLLIFGDQFGVSQVFTRLFIVVSGIFVFPLGAAIEMYYRGGKAGLELKRKVSESQSIDPAIADKEVSDLINCVQKLSAIAEGAKSGFPSVGTNSTLAIVQETFMLSVKNDLENCLRECSRQVGGKYPATLSSEGIDRATDFHELMREIEGVKLKLMRVVESIG